MISARAAGGVVDARLRVHGAANLRVADASAFPLLPSGNLQATVYAVAERAADFLKEARAERRRAAAAAAGGDDGATGGWSGSTAGSVDEESGGGGADGDASVDDKGSDASA